jgi:hypothetical protein
MPHNRRKNTTLLPSMTLIGMVPCLAVVGSTTPEVFEAYVEWVMAPALRPGQVVVMNNLTAPKGERIKEMIEERSCELLFMPPFRGDRRAPTKVEARPRESLVEAMSAAI